MEFLDISLYDILAQKKNISSKTKHKQLLRISRMKKLEEKMKVNIKKRKKSS